MARTKKEIPEEKPMNEQFTEEMDANEGVHAQADTDLPVGEEEFAALSDPGPNTPDALDLAVSQTEAELGADAALLVNQQDSDLSQTDPQADEVLHTGLADLELAATDTLDPDAPQTDLNADGHTDSLDTAPDELYQGDCDLEDGRDDPLQADDGSTSQTGSELAEEMDILQLGQEQSQEDSTPGETDGDPAVAGSDLEAPQVKRRRSRRKASTPEAADESVEAEAADDDQADSVQAPKLRMPGRRRQRVVSIDAERTVATDTDKLRNDLLDLVESLKGKKILTGTIQGVERLADNPEMSYAVVYHGDFKVIIPVLEAIEEPEDYRDQSKGDVLHYLLNKRLGAEVDYIVKGVDQESNVVAASRLEAMALKRREYYFKTDRDGNFQIYEGIRAEARVVSVIRAGIFVDLFGVECYIPLRELSYQRWVDAAAHYQPGQRVLVKVLSVDRSDRNRPRVSASVKQAMDNPYEKALKKYVVGNRYVGTVSMVDLNGVFVSLDGGIDCLCTYPKRGRPPRGARATVRILGINRENNRIWGVITHMSMMR